MCTQGGMCRVPVFSVADDELVVEMPSTIWSTD